MDEDEGVKGWFHAIAGAYAAILLGYNVKQAIVTKKPRNVVNAAIYALAVGWELHRAKSHWQGTA